jgi:hypothetical protein
VITPVVTAPLEPTPFPTVALPPASAARPTPVPLPIATPRPTPPPTPVPTPTPVMPAFRACGAASILGGAVENSSASAEARAIIAADGQLRSNNVGWQISRPQGSTVVEVKVDSSAIPAEDVLAHYHENLKDRDWTSFIYQPLNRFVQLSCVEDRGDGVVATFSAREPAPMSLTQPGFVVLVFSRKQVD